MSDTIADRDFLRLRLRERLLAARGRESLTLRQKDALLYQVSRDLGVTRDQVDHEVTVLAAQARLQLQQRMAAMSKADKERLQARQASRRSRMQAAMAGLAGFLSQRTLDKAPDVRRAVDNRRSRTKEALAGLVGALGLRSFVSAENVLQAAQLEAVRFEHDDQAFDLVEYMEFFADFEDQPGFGWAQDAPASTDLRDQQLDDQGQREAQHAAIASDARAERERQIARIRAHPDFLGEPEDERYAHP